MNILIGILVGCLILAGAVVGYLVVLCVRYFRKASATDRLLSAFKDDHQGLYKRIDEVRELQSALQTLAPERICAEPWILSWCASQERWLEQLASDLEVLDPDIAKYGARGRERYGL